jgi:hypothetical protein
MNLQNSWKERQKLTTRMIELKGKNCYNKELYKYA